MKIWSCKIGECDAARSYCDMDEAFAALTSSQDQGEKK